ncbi:MAG TPA: glycosyltransferase [Candidatus Nanoarchaeia archaeon]|nr:glycosyltransferase [Candidatus Nanoarchaeia archaeon]
MPRQMPLVSVIIPTHNVSKIILRCLLSIQRQSYKKIETLIIDDSSTDGTKDAVRRYAKYIRFIDPQEEKQRKLGIPFKRSDKRSRQRNHGAEIAHGSLLLFIDSDMVLPSDLIEKSVSAIKDNDGLLIYDKGIGMTFWSKCHSFEKEIHEGDSEVTSPRLIKRSAFMAVKGIDESLVLNEDLDLHDRLIKSGYKIGVMNEPKIYHYESDTLRDVVKKYFHYGGSFKKYASKNPGKSAKLYILYHPYLYLKNWRKLLRSPLHGFGSILRKVIEYSAAGAGFLASLTRK